MQDTIFEIWKTQDSLIVRAHLIEDEELCLRLICDYFRGVTIVLFLSKWLIFRCIYCLRISLSMHCLTKRFGLCMLIISTFFWLQSCINCDSFSFFDSTIFTLNLQASILSIDVYLNLNFLKSKLTFVLFWVSNLNDPSRAII